MITTVIQTAIREIMGKIPYSIKFRTGLSADINTQATRYRARQGMPHYAVDTGVLYIFDGDSNIPVSLGSPYVAKTANYTVSVDDGLIDCTSGTFTITLPTAVGLKGRKFTIKNSGVGTITVDANGSETIDGDLTIELYDKEWLDIVSNNVNWIII